MRSNNNGTLTKKTLVGAPGFTEDEVVSPAPFSSRHHRKMCRKFLKTLRQLFIPDSRESHKTGRRSETGHFAKSQLGQEDCVPESLLDAQKGRRDAADVRP